jgi:hypothetical protein
MKAKSARQIDSFGLHNRDEGQKRPFQSSLSRSVSYGGV